MCASDSDTKSDVFYPLHHQRINYGTVYLEIASHSKVKGSIPETNSHLRLQRPTQLPGFLYFWQSIDWWFPWPPPQVRLTCYGSSQNSRETFYLLDYQFIIKGYNSEPTRWKRCIGQGNGVGALRSTLSRRQLFPHLLFTNLEAL